MDLDAVWDSDAAGEGDAGSVAAAGAVGKEWRMIRIQDRTERVEHMNVKNQGIGLKGFHKLDIVLLTFRRVLLSPDT